MTPAKKAPPALDPAEQLERHVAFELARWQDDALTATLREEIGATRAWLTTVTLRDIAPPEPTAALLARHLSGITITDEMIGLAVDALVAGRAALASMDEPRPTADQTSTRESIDALIDAVAGLDEARSRVLGAITASTAYQGLVGQVLYQGIKAYLLTENIVAKRIPGATSLVRFGQRSLQTAAPGFENAIDRQLTAFVQANIAETARESRRYLEENADAAMIRAMADEAWAALEGRPLADLADIVTDADLEELTLAAGPLVRGWLGSGLLGSLAEQTVCRLLAEYGDHQVADLLAQLGLGDDDSLATALADLVRPGLARARHSGQLEERIRARLAPFYASLE